jgi:hypothetical protein
MSGSHSGGRQVTGAEFSVGWDAAALFQLAAPFADAAVQSVPDSFVHAQGGADVMTAALGLHAVVQSHKRILL